MARFFFCSDTRFLNILLRARRVWEEKKKEVCLSFCSMGTMGANTCTYMLVILLTWFVTSPIIRRSLILVGNCFTSFFLALGNISWKAFHSYFLLFTYAFSKTRYMFPAFQFEWQSFIFLFFFFFFVYPNFLSRNSSNLEELIEVDRIKFEFRATLFYRPVDYRSHR